MRSSTGCRYAVTWLTSVTRCSAIRRVTIVVMSAMPIELPICRVRLYMPDPAAISLLGRGPSAARLRGMNIITEPTARRISGQKMVCTPVSGFTPMSSQPVAEVINAPMPIIRRGSNRDKYLP